MEAWWNVTITSVPRLLVKDQVTVVSQQCHRPPNVWLLTMLPRQYFTKFYDWVERVWELCAKFMLGTRELHSFLCDLFLRLILGNFRICEFLQISVICNWDYEHTYCHLLDRVKLWTRLNRCTYIQFKELKPTYFSTPVIIGFLKVQKTI